jgi:hypothetical protein
VFDLAEVRELQSPLQDMQFHFGKPFLEELRTVFWAIILLEIARSISGTGEHYLLRDIFLLLVPLMRCKGPDAISTKGAPVPQCFPHDV